jgi:glycosyltransferase involved in cell wall biosynthesis
MTVSVAIATYNRAGMVSEAIRAALDQTAFLDGAPAEIVVVDDASTDRTAAVLEEFARKDGRVRVFRQAVNSGGVGNWNRAIGETRGEFIAWCSDDDRFLPDHLEGSLAYLDAHPEIGMVHSGFVDALESKGRSEWIPRRLRAARPVFVTRRNLVAYMIRYYDWPFHPSTLVLRRDVWERTGAFDPAFALADTDWFVRAAELVAVAWLPRHGVLNRRHAGNWSNRIGSAGMQREIFEIVERAIARRFDDRWAEPLGRAWWRFLWRANVRMRLSWTLLMRLSGGHAPAACAAWKALVEGTGRRAPGWVERAGTAAIRRWCAGREAGFADVGESVSPL